MCLLNKVSALLRISALRDMIAIEFFVDFGEFLFDLNYRFELMRKKDAESFKFRISVKYAIIFTKKMREMMQKILNSKFPLNCVTSCK